MGAQRRRRPDVPILGRPCQLGAKCWLVLCLAVNMPEWASAQSVSGAGTGAAGQVTFLPGIRTSIVASDSTATASGSSGGSYSIEVAPYLNASISNARTNGSIRYQMRNLYVHNADDSRALVRHDLRASLDSLIAGDWLGVQSTAAIYNTNASIAGGLSADPATSVTNNAVLRRFSVAPYVRGRIGAFATYKTQYRYEQSDTSSNVSAAVARASHNLNLNVAGGPQFNPWGWTFNANGLRREFSNNVTLSSTSAVASLYYTPSAELRLGASLNYLYIERLTNSSGDTSGWGPGVSVDWSPSRRTTVRASITRQYYGSNETLSIAHRTNRFVFGLDYRRSVLESNNAALLTFNPGAIFSGGGFSPTLNPLFSQLNSLGLLSDDSTVLGTNIINDALVRNRTLTASFGYVMPRWSATATVFRSTRETVLESQVFGIPNGLSPASFGLFNTNGITLAGTLTLDARNSVGISANVRDASSSNNNNDTKTRFSIVQATYTSHIDDRSSATLGLRRTVQSGSSSAGRREVNAIFGTYDHRFR